jgi:hypothetical protein
MFWFVIFDELTVANNNGSWVALISSLSQKVIKKVRSKHRVSKMYTKVRVTGSWITQDYNTVKLNGFIPRVLEFWGFHTHSPIISWVMLTSSCLWKKGSRIGSSSVGCEYFIFPLKYCTSSEMTKSSGYAILSRGKISWTRSTVPTVTWTHCNPVMFSGIDWTLCRSPVPWEGCCTPLITSRNSLERKI